MKSSKIISKQSFLESDHKISQTETKKLENLPSFDIEMPLTSHKSQVMVIARFRPLNQMELKIDTLYRDRASTQDNDDFEDPKKVTKPFEELVEFQEDNQSVTINDRYFLKTNAQGLNFRFDRVFKPGSMQSEIFDFTAAIPNSRNVVEDALNGYNSTIMAYGQTGSGKTYTMFGPDIEDERQKGIIPRVSQSIFDAIRYQFSDESSEDCEF